MKFKKIFGILFTSFALTFSALLVFTNKSDFQEAKATEQYVETDLLKDWNGNGVTAGSTLVSYHNITGGAQINANSTSLSTNNKKVTTPTSARVQFKNHSDHDLVLTIFYRISSSNADGCYEPDATHVVNVTSANNKSSYTRYSSGSGFYVKLGANDLATFEVPLKSGTYIAVRIGICIGVTTEQSGNFELLSWQTYDSATSQWVDTMYTFKGVSTTNLNATVATPDSNQYKMLTTQGFKGIPIHFYDSNYTTYDNPSPLFEINPYGGYKQVQLRQANSNDMRLYVGYASSDGVSTEEGSSLVINKTSSSTNFSKLVINHHNSITWHDNMYYYTSSDDGVTWSARNKVDWTGDGDAKTATLELSSGVTSVKLVQFANGDSTLRANIVLSSIQAYYSSTNSHELSFDTQGGSVVASQYIDPTNSEVTVRPSNPTHPNEGGYSYAFDDWYDEAEGGNVFTFGNTINEDTVIYAHWIKTVLTDLTITFDSNGGTSVNPIVVAAGDVAAKPSDPTRSTENENKYHYNFAGWYTDSGLTSAYDWSSSVQDDLTLHAKWDFVLADVPEDANYYSVNTHGDKWAATGSITSYQTTDPVVINSYATFNTEKTLPEINLSFTRLNGHYGFYVHSTWSPIVRDVRCDLTLADTTKVITYARFVFNHWGNDNNTMNLYSNGGSTAIDTEPGPTSSGYIQRFLEKSFAASDLITSVSFDVGSTSMINFRYIYLKVAENPNHTAAVAYATSFNNAQVCGTQPTDGLDTEKWNDQKTAYLALDESVRLYLTRSEVTDGELGEMLERYDRVVYLHGQSYDFMNRISAGKVSPQSLSNYVGLFQMEEGNQVAVVVAITCLATLSVLGLFFYSRKRKKNN